MTALTSAHRVPAPDPLPSPTPAPVPRMIDEAGVRLGVAHVALVVATLVACAVGLPATASLTLLGLVAVASGLWLPAPWAAFTGVSAWALWTGFCENALGRLTLAGGDLRHLALLPLLAGAGVLLHHGLGGRRG